MSGEVCFLWELVNGAFCSGNEREEEKFSLGLMLEKSFSWTIRRDCCECNVTCDSMEIWLFFLTEKSELSLSKNPDDYQLWRQPPELPISTTFNSHKHSKVFFAFLFLRLPPWENYLKSWEWSVVLPGHESRWIFKKQTRNITQPANLRHRDSAPSRWILNNDTNRLRVFCRLKLRLLR